MEHIEKSQARRKSGRKSTYPPPADGPCVLFLCTSGCSANEAAAQAGRGALQAIVNFTKCKVLKGNEARLHSGAQCGHGDGALECPVSLGENFENVGFGGFSKTRTIFLGRRLAVCGDWLNSMQATADEGCGRFEGFHRTEGDGLISFTFLQPIRPPEKTAFFLRLILKDGEGISKRAI